MDLDRIPLWSQRGDVNVGDLWLAYANYPYMPRLANFEVLCNAISDGTALMNWAAESFVYAEAHNDITWVGVHIAQLVRAQRSGWIIHPDAVPDEPAGEHSEELETESDFNSDTGESSTVSVKKGSEDGTPIRAQFYARFDLDRVRAIRQLEDILTNVTNHLEGSVVTLTLEVNAQTPKDGGYDDRTRRVVAENARQLGGEAEFE
jgi:hypothetical protein